MSIERRRVAPGMYLNFHAADPEGADDQADPKDELAGIPAMKGLSFADAADLVDTATGERPTSWAAIAAIDRTELVDALAAIQPTESGAD